MIYAETSPRYVERVSAPTLTFIDRDRFIVREETTSGWMHLYMHSLDKGRLHPVTQGEWEVTEIVSATPERICYLSTETSPLRRDLYTVRCNGKGKKRLTGGDG